jgi:hypothetical protein
MKSMKRFFKRKIKQRSQSATTDRSSRSRQEEEEKASHPKSTTGNSASPRVVTSASSSSVPKEVHKNGGTGSKTVGASAANQKGNRHPPPASVQEKGSKVNKAAQKVPQKSKVLEGGIIRGHNNSNNGRGGARQQQQFSAADTDSDDVGLAPSDQAEYKGVSCSFRGLNATEPFEDTLPVDPDGRLAKASEAYDAIPLLEQNKLPRGGISMETKAVGRIQVRDIGDHSER